MTIYAVFQGAAILIPWRPRPAGLRDAICSLFPLLSNLTSCCLPEPPRLPFLLLPHWHPIAWHAQTGLGIPSLLRLAPGPPSLFCHHCLSAWQDKDTFVLIFPLVFLLFCFARASPPILHAEHRWPQCVLMPPTRGLATVFWAEKG